MSGANQTEGVLVNLAEQWRAYDALPAELRRVYAFAPYKFYIRPITWPKSRLVAIMLEIRDEAIARAYGPDHPQIGSRTLERRPEKRLRR